MLTKKEELNAKIEELEKEKKKALEESQVANDSQVAYKILLNSVYGYIGTKFSPVFNKTIAEAVTKSGQHCTREMVGYTNNLLNELVGTDKSKEWVVAGDTDSVIGTTLVKVNKCYMTIEEAFNSLPGHIDVLVNGTEVKVIDGEYNTDTFSNYSRIANISRHKVDKLLFKVSIPNGRSVVMTKDHSLIVLRDGKMIEEKPAEMRFADMIAYKENGLVKYVKVSECKVCFAGKTEDYVYDMEVDDNEHMFFANDILVHNSLYVRIDNVLTKLFGTTDVDWYDQDNFNKIQTFVDTYPQKKLNNHIADFICETCYTDQRRIEFKREKISSEGDFLSKKHYALHARDNEGLPCDKFEYKGVDIAKNELTTTVKGILRYMVENMMKFNWSQEKICSELQEQYKKYCQLDVEDIGYIKNLNKTKDALSDTVLSIESFDNSGDDGLELDKGAGVHARASRIYNSVLKHMGLNNVYEAIKQSDRIRYVYLKKSNKYEVDCVAWLDKYPTEFRDVFEVDYDMMWEKTIMSPLKKFFQNHHCDASKAILQECDQVLATECGESLF